MTTDSAKYLCGIQSHILVHDLFHVPCYYWQVEEDTEEIAADEQ